MSSPHADLLLRRMEQRATILGQGDPDGFMDCPYPNEPRWRIDSRWIEFECGCRAERCMELTLPRKSDPIIFRDLPEQAVYDYVCHKHNPSMNKRVKFMGYETFDQWKRDRRATLMGRVKF